MKRLSQQFAKGVSISALYCMICSMCVFLSFYAIYICLCLKCISRSWTNIIAHTHTHTHRRIVRWNEEENRLWCAHHKCTMHNIVDMQWPKSRIYIDRIEYIDIYCINRKSGQLPCSCPLVLSHSMSVCSAAASFMRIPQRSITLSMFAIWLFARLSAEPNNNNRNLWCPYFPFGKR